MIVQRFPYSISCHVVGEIVHFWVRIYSLTQVSSYTHPTQLNTGCLTHFQFFRQTGFPSSIYWTLFSPRKKQTIEKYCQNLRNFAQLREVIYDNRAVAKQLEKTCCLDLWHSIDIGIKKIETIDSFSCGRLFQWKTIQTSIQNENAVKTCFFPTFCWYPKKRQSWWELMMEQIDLKYEIAGVGLKEKFLLEC